MQRSSSDITVSKPHTATINLFPEFTGSIAVEGMQYVLPIVIIKGIGAIYQRVIAFMVEQHTVCLLFENRDGNGYQRVFLLRRGNDGESELYPAYARYNPDQPRILVWPNEKPISTPDITTQTLDQLRREIASTLK